VAVVSVELGFGTSDGIIIQGGPKK